MPGISPRSYFHSECVADLLIYIRANSTLFSECALISLKVLPDFDSSIRRFECSRPSQAVRVSEKGWSLQAESPANGGGRLSRPGFRRQ